MHLLQKTEFEEFKAHKRKSYKHHSMSREENGPEFDDHLIKLVRENPAIYDVSHPHYRRTPIRMTIWDNIARELGASSRYLQTKWKNIRYNYLQEQKCLETGTFNTNLRKRRFTADLSFLKYTAFRRDGSGHAAAAAANAKAAAYNNGSDNDSNSFMYPDNLTASGPGTSFEVIELDHSDDEGDNGDYMPDVSAFLAPMNDITEGSPQDPYAHPDNCEETPEPDIKHNRLMLSPHLQNGNTLKLEVTNYIKSDQRSNSPESPHSSRSSPLLTPINGSSAADRNGDNKPSLNGNTFSEVTIRPLPSLTKKRSQSNSPCNAMPLSAAKRKLTSIMPPTLQSNKISTPGVPGDPIELYCLSLVDCLRAMPRSERERVKFEFSKILKDARYNNQS